VTRGHLGRSPWNAESPAEAVALSSDGDAASRSTSLKRVLACAELVAMGALWVVAGVLMVIGVVVALLITPILLVWPRAWSRLVPPRWRDRFVEHPGQLITLPAAVLAVWSAAAMSPLILASGDPARSAAQKALAVALVWIIFGGLTGAAVARTLRIGIAEWAISSPPRTASSAPLTVPFSPTLHANTRLTPTTQPTAPVGAHMPGQRPVRCRPDRVLRNATRWLATAGMGWYLLGRAVQIGGHDASVPNWWWSVTVALLIAGVAVWLARRVRWRADGRGHSLTSPGSGFDSVLREAGLSVHRPAGSWVVNWAPLAFVAPSAITGPALWPWAGTGIVNGLPVLVAAQHGQFRNTTGLTGGRARTACAIRLNDTHLPQVVIAERESIPPQRRHESLPLESESFNRSMWIYGPDARGVYDVVHPRAMSHALQELPDGTSVIMQGQTLAVISDEPVSPSQLRQMMTFAVQFAELTPGYLRKKPTSTYTN